MPVTKPTTYRLPDDVRVKLVEIQRHYGLPSEAAAIRFAATQVHAAIAPAPPPKPKRPRP